MKSGKFTADVEGHHIQEIGKTDKGIVLFKYCFRN